MPRKSRHRQTVGKFQPLQKEDERQKRGLVFDPHGPHDKWLEAEVTWDPADITASGEVGNTVNVPGAANGDFVLASLSSLGLGAYLYTTLFAFVDGADTVRVYLMNHDTVAHNFSSGILKVRVMKQ